MSRLVTSCKVSSLRDGINHMMVSVSEENISGIDTHFRKYCIDGINTFGIILPITKLHQSLPTIELGKVVTEI